VNCARILVINPNTNPRNTKVIADAICAYRKPDLEVDVVNPITITTSLLFKYTRLLLRPKRMDIMGS
jgi:Asp/Glu/hydantoin racemase